MKKIFLLAGIFALMNVLTVNAQVTIGTKEEPVHGAMLQLKSVNDAVSNGRANAIQGIGLPRVELVKKDQLQPMYPEAEASTLSDEQKLAHRGLIVFNVKEIDSENLSFGINVWDGNRWAAASETQSRAEFTFDCNKVRLYGRYFQRTPLTNNNYLVLPLTVSKKGEYSIVASTENGYYFQASGILNAPGNYEVRLIGMGTPADVSIDSLAFTNNGAPLSACNNLDIRVSVSTLTYRINDPENIEIFGDYQARKEMDSYTNYAKIPVEVIIEGTTSWETHTLNGVKFVVSQTFDAPGADTLIVKAQGIPKQAGTFVYNFTTDGSIKNQGSFAVYFTSTLGTFSDPACKCLDIYDERPDAANGEYFLLDCEDATATVPVKTFCDLSGGGYTLVWSFSERTDLKVYTGNTMVMNADYRFASNKPRNRVTTENGSIDYTDYRLSRNEFMHFPYSETKPMLKVRICENPTDMNDEWGLHNYGIMSPRSQTENPIYSTFTSLRVPSTGKVFGKRWEQKTTGGGDRGGWDEISGNRLIAAYSNTSYPMHWDWGRNGSSTLFEVIPKKEGAYNNLAKMNDFNNTFGWFGEDQPNHHFGKCGGASASDYDFTIKKCGGSSLQPHNSINDGEGRYLQWFVK